MKLRIFLCYLPLFELDSFFTISRSL